MGTATSLTLLTCLALPCAAAAQGIYLPAGAGTVAGNSNNTVPWWSTSATYQQVHDFADMSKATGGSTFLMSGMSFRKGIGPSSLAGRTLEVQITVGHTPVTSQTTSLTFADNLGPSPSTVLPFTLVNLPGLTNQSTPNPPGWILSFDTPFLYVPVAGNNFAWEWRHRNASTNTAAPMDAFFGERVAGISFEGAGCVATGQTAPAKIGLARMDMTGFTYRNRLDRGAANALAVFSMGFTRNNLQTPSLCASLLLEPTSLVGGTTDATGQWDLTLPTEDLRGQPSTEFLGQFIFLDRGLRSGRGLSDMSVIRTPLSGAARVTRVYLAPPFSQGSGFEKALFAAQQGRRFGLVVGFQ